MVGPILAEDAKHLPEALDNVIAQGLVHGHAGIYVSLGTWASLTAAELQSTAKTLSALPNPVLWKLDIQYLPGAQPAWLHWHVQL